MSENDDLRFEVSADASGLTAEMRAVALAAEKAAAQTQGSANKISKAVETMAAQGKTSANKLVKSLKDMDLKTFEMKAVFDKLNELGKVTNKLSDTNKRMFADSSAAAQKYGAAVAAAAAEIKASGKMLNGNPLSDNQIQRLATMRAQQGPDRSESFQSAKAVTSSAFLESQPASISNAFVQQQRTLNEQATRTTDGAASATNRFAESEKKLTSAMSGGLSARMKDDAVIRALQGNLLSGVRAAGAFITTIPLLNKALTSLFDVVGALAVVGIVVDIGNKIQEAIRKIELMPDAIRRGFDELNRSSDLSVSSLELSNQKIRDRIALIEHKPVNGMADALDEARVKADQLAIALAGDDKAMAGLLKTNSIGFIGGLLGKDSTKTVSDRVRGYNTALQTDADTEAEATDRGDLAGAKVAHSKLTKDLHNFINNLDLDRAMRASSDKNVVGYDVMRGLRGETPYYNGTYAQVNGNQDANVAIDEGAAREYRNRLALTQGEDDETKLIGQEKDAENKVKGDKYGETANEKKLTGYQSQLSDLQDSGNIGADDVYKFWQAKITAFQKGSKEYNDVVKAANSAYRQVSEENNQALTSANIAGGLLPNVKGFFGQQVTPRNQPTVRPDDLTKSEPDAEGTRQDSQAAIQNLHNLGQIPVIAQKAAISMRDASLAIQVSQGQISRLGAATVQAKIHSDDYAESLARLKQSLADINLNTAGLTPNQQAAARSGVNNQISDLNNKNAVQVVQDSAAIDQTHLATAWKDSMNIFVQESEDAAKQIGNIFTSTMDSVNDTLANSITAQYRSSRERWAALKNGLGDDIRGAGTKLSKASLQKAEGAGLKALGFGKPGKADGSQSSPFYVKFADKGASATNGPNVFTKGLHTVGNFVHRLFGGGGSSAPLLNTGGADPLGLNAPSAVSDDGTNLGTTSDTAIGASGIDKVGASILGIGSSLLPKVIQGKFAAGGDVVSGLPAIVGEQGPELFMPKSAGTIIPNNQAFGSTTHNHSWNIDARGAHDPAAVNAAVQRGIRQAAPHLISASIAAGTERNKRRPASAR